MILIVDDRAENILSLKKILELHAFDVDTADSGEEALKKILKNEYYLVILDVQMPGMDGFEVAEAISSLNKTKDIPILFLSAVNIDKKFVARGFQSGGIDYLTKPFDPDILILKVRTFYRLYQQTQALKMAHQSLQAEMEIRKKTEQSLKHTLGELHSTLESLPQIAFSADSKGNIDFVNKIWFDYAEDNGHFPLTENGEGHIQSIWLPYLDTKKPLSCEVKIKKLNDTEFEFFLLRIIPVIIKDEVVKWVGTFTNIHEQKMMNDKLERKVAERTNALEALNHDLEVSNNDLQQFASVASHDLKEPLRKIQFFSSSIIDKFQVEEDIKFYLAKINHSSKRMSRLIDDLLNFSKLSETLVFEKVDLNKVGHEVLSDLELVINEYDATVEITQLPVIDAIPGLMRQFFQNVLSNALKFSIKDRKPLIRILGDITESPSECLDFNGLSMGKWVTITIIDNGIGFETEYAEKIFNLFQRLHPKELYEGTGIGLTIVKKIIEKHHGFIRAVSKPGEGATFIIQLPIIQTLKEN